MPYTGAICIPRGSSRKPKGVNGPRGAPMAAQPSTHLGVAPLLLPDEHERGAVDAANPADDCGVVEAGAVAMQLHKLVRDVEDDVEACRPVGVAGYLKPLGRRQPAVGLLAQLSSGEQGRVQGSSG